MQRNGLIAALIVSLLICFSVVRSEEPITPGEFKKSRGQISQLREDISLGNLINGLYLTQEQTQQLLAYAKQAEALRTKFKAEAESLQPELTKAFTELREEVVKGTGINQEIGRRAARLNHQAKELRMELNHQLCQLEQKTGEVLTAGQKEIIRDFAPCLLPPRNLGEPERAGQAANYTHLVKRFDRLREIPLRRYYGHKHRVIDGYFAKLDEIWGIKLTEDKRRQEYQRLSQLLDHVRLMDGMELELDKEQLAKEFSRLVDEKKKERQAHQRLYADGHRLGKIGRFLLSPRAVTVLEAKEAYAGQYKERATANLLRIPAAENCADGSCALKK